MRYRFQCPADLKDDTLKAWDLLTSQTCVVESPWSHDTFDKAFDVLLQRLSGEEDKAKRIVVNIGQRSFNLQFNWTGSKVDHFVISLIRDKIHSKGAACRWDTQAYADALQKYHRQLTDSQIEVLLEGRLKVPVGIRIKSVGEQAVGCECSELVCKAHPKKPCDGHVVETERYCDLCLRRSNGDRWTHRGEFWCACSLWKTRKCTACDKFSGACVRQKMKGFSLCQECHTCRPLEMCYCSNASCAHEAARCPNLLGHHNSQKEGEICTPCSNIQTGHRSRNSKEVLCFCKGIADNCMACCLKTEKACPLEHVADSLFCALCTRSRIKAHAQSQGLDIVWVPKESSASLKSLSELKISGESITAELSDLSSRSVPYTLIHRVTEENKTMFIDAQVRTRTAVQKVLLAHRCETIAENACSLNHERPADLALQEYALLRKSRANDWTLVEIHTLYRQVKEGRAFALSEECGLDDFRGLGAALRLIFAGAGVQTVGTETNVFYRMDDAVLPYFPADLPLRYRQTYWKWSPTPGVTDVIITSMHGLLLTLSEVWKHPDFANMSDDAAMLNSIAHDDVASFVLKSKQAEPTVVPSTCHMMDSVSDRCYLL